MSSISKKPMENIFAFIYCLPFHPFFFPNPEGKQYFPCIVKAQQPYAARQSARTLSEVIVLEELFASAFQWIAEQVF